VDAAIGRVVRDIRRRGLWHRTLLIIFSDHGEHLYEAGNTTDHGKWFRGDEANRIPLIIAGGPLEVRGKVVEGVVRSIDVLPTLLGLLGLAGPDTMEGVDVGPRIRGDETGTQAAFAETGIWLDGASTFQGVEDALIYPSIDKLLTLEDGDLLVLRDRFNDDVEKAKHRCIRTEEWKLVYIPTRTGFRVELYDVVKDPANTHNLAAAQPEVVRRLSRRLRRWMLRDPGKHFNKAGHLVPRYCYYE